MIQACKNRKSNANLAFNIYFEIDNNKLNIFDTSNIKNKFKNWFQNKNTNKNSLDIKEEKDNNKNTLKLKVEKSKTINPKILMKEIQQNKKRENKLCGIYKIRSRLSSKKQ